MRNRPLRLLAASALALVAVTAGPVAQTLACSCAMLGPADALTNADVAFVGVVARSEDPTGGGPIVGSGDPITYTFAVEQSLKGELARGGTVLVRSARDGASCGMTFALAQRWRVYAYVADGNLATGLCSGNELLAEQVPIPQLTDDAAPPPTELLLAAGAVLLLLVVSGVAFLRGGRRSAA